ncbi:SLAC1 anion channel family protein [Thiolinea disciformis]|uniref:SLAC1 anion channel family protein n=1 Tax=Thiolinea disciformis TaxID=125614 RepID=UPI00035E55F0|nr:SLAC1 anion channel family protein [Thiolinea disciformis]
MSAPPALKSIETPVSYVSTSLSSFPVAFFSVVIGIAGVTLAWEKAAVLMGQPVWIDQALLFVAPLIFIVVSAFYLVKWLRHAAAARLELHHSQHLAFLPCISVGLLLISLSLLASLPVLAKWIWMIGTSLHLLLSLVVLNAWMQKHLQPQQLSATWFIPALGHLLVPFAGVPLGFVYISWFYFSVGLLFWVILSSIVYYRILFHTPPAARLITSLLMLIAPPAIGFMAYLQLTQSFDAFALCLYYASLFLTLLLFTQLHLLARLRFCLSWWAYSFPLAAITLATFSMYQKTQTFFFLWLGIFLLLMLNIVIVILLVNTIRAILNNAICVED